MPRILLIGTADTKSAELLYLRERIAAAGGVARVMDVGVMAPADFTPDIDHAQVACAGRTSLLCASAVTRIRPWWRWRRAP